MFNNYDILIDLYRGCGVLEKGETPETLLDKDIKKWIRRGSDKLKPSLRENLLQESQAYLEERVGIKAGDIETPKKKYAGTSAERDLTKRSGIDLQESATCLESEGSFCTNLKESSYNSESGELTFETPSGNYSPKNFIGKKMFLNRATVSEKRDRPERNLRDWAGTITEAWLFGDGKITAKARIHDGKLKSLLENPTVRKEINLSVNSDGSVDLVV